MGRSAKPTGSEFRSAGDSGADLVAARPGRELDRNAVAAQAVQEPFDETSVGRAQHRVVDSGVSKRAMVPDDGVR
jgi:hypothetical protein